MHLNELLFVSQLGGFRAAPVTGTIVHRARETSLQSRSPCTMLPRPLHRAERGAPARLVSPDPNAAAAPSAGAELPAGLAVPEEVEDDHPGLHQVPPR